MTYYLATFKEMDHVRQIYPRLKTHYKMKGGNPTEIKQLQQKTIKLPEDAKGSLDTILERFDFGYRKISKLKEK